MSSLRAAKELLAKKLLAKKPVDGPDEPGLHVKMTSHGSLAFGRHDGGKQMKNSKK
jgi:hypothetical protein